MKSVSEKFDFLKELVRCILSGSVKGLVTAGAPGIGKTYTILEEARKVSKSKTPKRIKHLTGHITPSATYNTLADYRDKDSLVIFDDCDNVFQDVKSLNILKAACDSSRVRTIHWESDRKNATPSFDFDGGIIVISNGRFSGPHYKAFLDRVHYYDMNVTTGEKIARIYDIAMKHANVSKDLAEEILSWLGENQSKVGYLSLRTFYKVAQLSKTSKTNWKKLAELTVFQSQEVR